MIERKNIEDRLAALRRDLAQIQANAHAVSGAIQVLESILLQEQDASKLNGGDRRGDHVRSMETTR